MHTQQTVRLIKVQIVLIMSSVMSTRIECDYVHRQVASEIFSPKNSKDQRGTSDLIMTNV